MAQPNLTPRLLQTEDALTLLTYITAARPFLTL